MLYDPLSGSDSDASMLIAGTPLAARQWEAWLLEQAPDSGRSVSRSLPLTSYAEWLRGLWERSGSRGLLLGEGQSLAAWRRVIDASRDDYPLLASDAAAAWALDAERRLQRFGVDGQRLRANAAQPDFAAFLRWRRNYRRRLADAGWLDLADAEQTLASRTLPTAGSLCLLDLHEQTPLQRRLLGALEQSGWRIASRDPPEAANRSVHLPLSDAERELEAAVDWAKQRLDGAAVQRVALVVDELPSRGREVSRALEAAFGAGSLPFWCEYESPIAEHPLIGAALAGIELLGPQGGFAHLSRWLRSPFFQGLDPEALGTAAAVETDIRASVLAQLPFIEAYRGAGLGGQLRRAAPALAARLEAALDEVGALGQPRTPTEWASRWQRSLRRLGWPATRAGADDAVMPAWERALERFTRLTPVLGPVTLATGVAELQGILQSARPQRPLPRVGLHVFADTGAVGPGYDAVWVTGATDRKWPAPPQLNPLLPRALQLLHGMPGATPRDTLERGRAAVARLKARVSSLVLSWPAQIGEQSAEPSPLLSETERVSPADLGLRAAADTPAFDPARIERRDDAPPSLAGPRIPGGVGTLNMQARCPLRAFCASRLDARPLEAPARGLPPRLQGIAAHRALQLLAQRQRGRPAGGAFARDADEALAGAVEQALAETFGAARRSFRELANLERRRLAALIRELLDAEAARAPFEIVATERRVEVAVGSWTVPCRIDRIDRLDDGTLAVIDYKTGTPPTVRDWFRGRLLQTQLPVYALHEPECVRALVVVALQRGAVAYKGTWAGQEHFPGRATRFPGHRDWPGQLSVWRRQIEALVAEYAAGDARLFDAELELAKGAYAPLSRVYEYAADRQRRRAGA